MKRKRNKLWSILLAFVMVAGLMPMTQVAYAKDSILTISEVSVTFPEPKAGDEVSEFDYSSITVPEGANYSIPDFYFADADGNEFTGTFEKGEKYAAFIMLGAKGAFYFKGGTDNFGADPPAIEDRVKFMVNGTDITEHEIPHYPPDWVRAWYEFTVGGDDYEISEVSVTFPEPKAGDEVRDYNFSNVKVPEGANYSIANFGFADADWTPFYDGTFEKGKKYAVVIWLETGSPFYFKGGTENLNADPPAIEDSVKFMVNGTDITENELAPYPPDLVRAIYEFTVGEISEVSVTFPEPKAGGSISDYTRETVKVPAGANYDIYDFIIRDADGKFFDGTFEKGKKYSFEIYLITGEPFYFKGGTEDLNADPPAIEDRVKFMVNGKDITEYEVPTYPPNEVAAWYEFTVGDGYEISEVSITFPEPKAGDEVSEYNFSDFKVPEGANYSIANFEFDDAYGVLFDGTFEKGKKYAAYIRLETGSPFYFKGGTEDLNADPPAIEDRVKFMVNGKDITEHEMPTYPPDWVTAWYEFTVDGEISEVSVTFPEPKAGDKASDYDISKAEVPEGAAYVIGEFYFYDADGVPFDGTFEKGKKYAAVILLEVDEPFYFKGGRGDWNHGAPAPAIEDCVKFMVNGKDITENEKAPYPPDMVEARYEFTVGGGSSGGGGGSATTKYTLTYNTNGGNSITATKHEKNATVNLTATPTREGYDFIGWFADKALKNSVTSVKMDGNKTVYAGWKEAGTEVETPEEDAPLLVIAIDKTTYQLNGKTMMMDSAPFIDGNNRTMLPVRVIANALGISNENIKWDSATKTAFFTRADGKVVSCTVNSNVIKVGDENVTIDTVPVIRNNRIYLPMRALFNAFDVPDENILWDAAARTVTVTKKD